MFRLLFVSLAAICCLALAGTALAASTDSHTVTVTVSAINELAISGANITLNINSATAGSEPDDASDSTTCDLVWTTNQVSRKITAETNLGLPNFTLKVTAANARIAQKRAAAAAEIDAARQAAMGDVESAVSDVVARATEIATGKPANSSTVNSAVQSAMGASTGATS